MNERQEQMIFDEGRRRGREEATKELMEWHDRVCEEMAKRHTADRPMLDDGTLVVNVSDATAVTRVLVRDEKKNGDLYYADRPKGEWIRTGRTNIYGGIEVQCSNCGDKVMVQHLEDEWYCRHCGADMGLKGADDE